MKYYYEFIDYISNYKVIEKVSQCTLNRYKDNLISTLADWNKRYHYPNNGYNIFLFNLKPYIGIKI